MNCLQSDLSKSLFLSICNLACQAIHHHPDPSSQVGQWLEDHFSKIPARQKQVMSDNGVAFQDFGDDTSDSGLESIL